MRKILKNVNESDTCTPLIHVPNERATCFALLHSMRDTLRSLLFVLGPAAVLASMLPLQANSTQAPFAWVCAAPTHSQVHSRVVVILSIRVQVGLLEARTLGDVGHHGAVNVHAVITVLGTLHQRLQQPARTVDTTSTHWAVPDRQPTLQGRTALHC